MAANISVREFQQQIARRIRAAEGESAASMRLGVQSGSRNWLLRLDDSGEVLQVPAISPVPLTVPWFLGLANVRGSLVGVVDFAAFSGEAATPHTQHARLVLIAERYATHAALLVSRMVGLRNLAEFQAEPREAASPWSGPGWRDRDGTLWHELALGALVESDEFLRVGAGAASARSDS